MSARTLSTALWCSVMPSVQQIIAAVGPREGVGGLADDRRRHARQPLALLQRERLDEAAYASKPSVAWSMKA